MIVIVSVNEPNVIGLKVIVAFNVSFLIIINGAEMPGWNIIRLFVAEIIVRLEYGAETTGSIKFDDLPIMVFVKLIADGAEKIGGVVPDAVMIPPAFQRSLAGMVLQGVLPENLQPNGGHVYDVEMKSGRDPL
jgi:hypothetical protein